MNSKTLSLALALFFAWAALLQLNDPDPIRWFALYAVAAALAAASAFTAVPRPCFAALAAVAGVWAAILLPAVLSERAFTGTEEEWELGGLLIVGLANLALYRRGASAPPSAPAA